MKLNIGMALSATAIAALTLTACGSDNNAGTSAGGSETGSASAADCGGKNSITAEGSTAQQNAIALFNQVWSQKCQGKNLSYNPTGSGAGREQFVAKNVDFAGSDSAIKEAQAQQAAERVAKETNGRVEIKIFPNNQLGGDTDMVALIGVLLGLLGGGGSILAVPALFYGMGFTMEQAIPISLIVVAAASAVGVLPKIRAKQVRWRMAGIFAAAGIPATIAGSTAGTSTPTKRCTKLAPSVRAASNSVTRGAPGDMPRRSRQRPSSDRAPAPRPAATVLAPARCDRTGAAPANPPDA